MKSTIISALAAAFLFMCSAVAVNAQNNTNQNQPRPAHHHMQANNNNNANATGCLQQSGNGGSYALTAQDGSTWQLTSNAVDLGKYVGKEVDVAGTEPRARGSHVRNVSTSQQGSEHGPLDVLDLSVVSERCQGR